MLTSVCVLGYGKEALEFVKEYKKVKYYKKRDSDTEGVRVHVVYAAVNDLASTKMLVRYDIGDNYANVINDGDQKTKREVTFSNDRDWLIESNGHDTIVDISDAPDKYYLTLLELIKPGYSIHLMRKKFTENYLEEVISLAQSRNARVTLHDGIDSILASLDAEYKEKLDLYRKNLYQESLKATPCGLPEEQSWQYFCMSDEYVFGESLPKFRSDVTVELVQSMGDDFTVVQAARVSTKGGDVIEGTDGMVLENRILDKKDQGLINYLMRDRHGTQFEHNAFTFYIEAPIFVFREFMRHRIASYNEESGRYKKLEPVFYIPKKPRGLIQSGKPGAYEFYEGSDNQYLLVAQETAEACRKAYAAYEEMLDHGVAREVAR